MLIFFFCIETPDGWVDGWKQTLLLWSGDLRHVFATTAMLLLQVSDLINDKNVLAQTTIGGM